MKQPCGKSLFLELLTQRTDEAGKKILRWAASPATGFWARLSFQMFGFQLQKKKTENADLRENGCKET